MSLNHSTKNGIFGALILSAILLTGFAPAAHAQVDIQAAIESELRDLAAAEGFTPELDNAFYSTRDDRVLAFVPSTDGTDGALLVAASGDQDGLASGVYTQRRIDDETYSVFLDGQIFATKLTIGEPGGGGCGGESAGVVSDLCGGASGSVRDICERLVACHYADLWCPW